MHTLILGGTMFLGRHVWPGAVGGVRSFRQGAVLFPIPLLRLFTAIAGVLILAGPAYASATAGLLRGLVVDDQGIPIPTALVTLASPALIGGAIRSCLSFTDNYADGIPNFLYNVAPGQYDRVLLCHETPSPPDVVTALGATAIAC